LDDERSSVFEKPKPGVIFTKDSGLWNKKEVLKNQMFTLHKKPKMQ
jgi:hypothetical protein